MLRPTVECRWGHHLADSATEPTVREPVDVKVPATAKIVIEGQISHTETDIEGPMGEFDGYINRSGGSPNPSSTSAPLPTATSPSADGKPIEETHTG